MMHRDQIAELLTIAAGADVRFPGLDSTQDPRIGVWQGILDGIRYVDAYEAMMRIVRRPQLQVLQPGHVIAEVKAIRDARLKAISAGDLVVPPEAADEDFLAWLRAARQAVADGCTVDEANEVADRAVGIDRRLTGPPTGRDVRAYIEGRTA